MLALTGPIGIDIAQADPAPKPAAKKSPTKQPAAKTTARSKKETKRAARYPVTALRGWTLNRPTSWAQFFPQLEIGFLAVPYHRLQQGRDGTRFSYPREGGQDSLFFFWRLQARLRLFGRHEITFLYQPLDIRTAVVLRRDTRIKGLTFPEGTPVTLRYGFDFYRVAYHWIAVRKSGFTFSFGLGLQLRNANIEFTSADGSLRRTARSVGPVPLLRIMSRYQATSRFWLEIEVDGFWAGDKIINGSTKKVEGWIVDASLRLGFQATSFLDIFLNARYLGGGAVGVGKDDPNTPGDGYTSNSLSTVIFSLGLGLR